MQHLALFRTGNVSVMRFRGGLGESFKYETQAVFSYKAKRVEREKMGLESNYNIKRKSFNTETKKKNDMSDT